MHQVQNKTFQMASEKAQKYGSRFDASDSEDQLIADILYAITSDDVCALEEAIQCLPAFHLNVFSINLVDSTDPAAKPVSLLGLAQSFESHKVSAFIIGVGLKACDPESLKCQSIMTMFAERSTGELAPNGPGLLPRRLH